MTDPYGSRGRPSPGPSAPRPSRPRWLGAALLLLVAVALAVPAALVVGAGRDVQLRAAPVPAAGSVVPAPELAGEWTGQGRLARCAGFDQGCPATRPVSLTIVCGAEPCAVTPFDRDHGSPPLELEDGSYQAAGPVPPDLAPTCEGAPTSSALWRLDITVRNGRLVGTYAESTLQGFDCDGTGVAWGFTLDRSGG